MKKIVLVFPQFLHNKGNLINAQSDTYYYFKTSIESLNIEHEIIDFETRDNKIFLNLETFKKIAEKNKDAVFLFEANNYPGDQSFIYPLGLAEVIEKLNLKTIAIALDIIKEINFNFWLKNSKFLIGTTKSGVKWANNYYDTNKFLFYPTWPQVKNTDFDTEKFLNRPYDFGYIGSNKIFRINFISSLLRLGSNRLSSIIISSLRSGSIINTSDKYQKVLKDCKFFFCTRAALYEEYENNNSLSYKTEGRYANRVSEAISCGCIPIYWQPRIKSSFFGLLERLLFSKLSKFLFLNNVKGNKESLPYDLNKKEQEGFFVAKDTFDAIKIIKNKDIQKIKSSLKFNNNFFEKYISPKNFFNFIFFQINDSK